MPSLRARAVWNATAHVDALVTASVSRTVWTCASVKLPPCTFPKSPTRLLINTGEVAMAPATFGIMPNAPWSACSAGLDFSGAASIVRTGKLCILFLLLGFGVAKPFGCLEPLLAVNAEGRNDPLPATYLGKDALANLPNYPRFPPSRSHGTDPGTLMPRRPATRHAVASRGAVIPATDWRACATIAAGAVSGVPLSKGGSGAYTI